jgi:hypothetical protein
MVGGSLQAGTSLQQLSASEELSTACMPTNTSFFHSTMDALCSTDVDLDVLALAFDESTLGICVDEALLQTSWYAPTLAEPIEGAQVPLLALPGIEGGQLPLSSAWDPNPVDVPPNKGIKSTRCMISQRDA